MMIAEITAWFEGRLPDDLYESFEIAADRDEIVVMGTLPAPDVPDEGGDDALAAACEARIQRFREDTRQRRMAIAREAESRFDRKVSWGARCGPVGVLFTHLAAPAMTRLRLKERRVLDTLIDSGVARSRSEALAWCVRLVAEHEGDWLEELREALVAVDEVRRRGPS